MDLGCNFASVQHRGIHLWCSWAFLGADYPPLKVSQELTHLLQYAAGATVQILMFSVLACKVKQNAPRCHTFLEIIYTRYGVLTHWVFIFFALLTNVLVSSQLLLGGSAVVTSLTGMNVYAAIFLIPLGVCVYVVLGGLRATFLCRASRQRPNVSC